MLQKLEDIAIEAGNLISQYRSAGPNISRKSDGSPVTDADEAAEELILRELQKLAPSVAVIAEESVSAGVIDIAPKSTVFLVDPLDGTKEFISGKPDYTVNICLVEDGRPKLGVVFAPARGELFSGDGSSAYRCRLGQDRSVTERARIRTSCSSGRLTAVASASHANAETRDFLGKLPIERTISVGSSLKFCLVAAADAHIYPRFGRTMQWDTAAGDAVLRSAGGSTLSWDGKEMEYGVWRSETNAFDNPYFVSYGGGVDELRQLLALGVGGRPDCIVAAK
ncbi:MAG: 3'(2'),5'-bisphosphate nucleotidase CysQ [Hyphomicrobium sp.]|uniref:3'(2'),5'-bisphosphate nucleotidase CysQ n=1 Tax=Hyphomicrobium sp. TaxID=82 RepID=UPI0039E61520